MIAIVDYGVGNLRSVQKALEKVGANAQITQDIELILKADKIVLPGVGAIKPAKEKLEALNLINPLKEVVANKKPFLGICVGFQLLFETSEEGKNATGLGFIKGCVKKFQALKVPQMGWNQLTITQPNCPLFQGIADQTNVYFCHSFYAQPEEDVITTLTDYGINYASSVWKENIFGVQFHPEKSQDVGLKILENFVKL